MGRYEHPVTHEDRARLHAQFDLFAHFGELVERPCGHHGHAGTRTAYHGSEFVMKGCPECFAPFDRICGGTLDPFPAGVTVGLPPASGR